MRSLTSGAASSRPKDSGDPMAINVKLLSYLTSAGARYIVFPHRVEFTAQEVAEASHVPGRELVKLVVLRDSEGEHLVVALPASMSVSLRHLERLTGRHALSLASEHELRALFPDCQVGAAPPFGHLYGVQVLMDPCLLAEPHVYFQAGNHGEVVSMRCDEFVRLARPARARECFHAAVSAVRQAGAAGEASEAHAAHAGQS